MHINPTKTYTLTHTHTHTHTHSLSLSLSLSRTKREGREKCRNCIIFPFEEEKKMVESAFIFLGEEITINSFLS